MLPKIPIKEQLDNIGRILGTSNHIRRVIRPGSAGTRINGIIDQKPIRWPKTPNPFGGYKRTLRATKNKIPSNRKQGQDWREVPSTYPGRTQRFSRDLSSLPMTRAKLGRVSQ